MVETLAGRPFLDLLCLAGEGPPEAGVPLGCFPLGPHPSLVSITPAQVQPLRLEAFVDGQVRMETPGRSSCSSGHQNLCWCLQVKLRLCSASETRTEVQKSLQTLHPRFQRLQEPDSYTVTRQHTEEPGSADTISDFICSGRKVSPVEESRGTPPSHTCPVSFPPPGGAVTDTPPAVDGVSQRKSQELPGSQLDVDASACLKSHGCHDNVEPRASRCEKTELRPSAAGFCRTFQGFELMIRFIQQIFI